MAARFLMFMAVMFILPLSALAQSLSVSAVERGGDTVEIKALVSADKPCSGCSVLVYNGAGQLVAEGTTSALGVLVAEASTERGLRIEVKDKAGRRGYFSITAKARTERSMQDENLERRAALSASQERYDTPTGLMEADYDSSYQDSEAMQDYEKISKMLDQKLEEQLAPIREDIHTLSHKGPGLLDVLGWFGYVVGILGIMAFIKSRRTGRE